MSGRCQTGSNGAVLLPPPALAILFYYFYLRGYQTACFKGLWASGVPTSPEKRKETQERTTSAGRHNIEFDSTLVNCLDLDNLVASPMTMRLRRPQGSTFDSIFRFSPKLIPRSVIWLGDQPPDSKSCRFVACISLRPESRSGWLSLPASSSLSVMYSPLGRASWP